MQLMHGAPFETLHWQEFLPYATFFVFVIARSAVGGCTKVLLIAGSISADCSSWPLQENAQRLHWLSASRSTTVPRILEDCSADQEDPCSVVLLYQEYAVAPFQTASVLPFAFLTHWEQVFLLVLPFSDKFYSLRRLTRRLFSMVDRSSNCAWSCQLVSA